MGKGLISLPHYSITTSPVWLLVVAVISTEKCQWLSDTPIIQKVDNSLRSFRWDVRLEISALIGELDQSPPANVLTCTCTRRDCFTCTTVGTHAVFIIDAIADYACECYNSFCTFTSKCKLFLYMHSIYVAAPVRWWVKVAVWPPLLTVVHSTTLMTPAPHLVIQISLLHPALTTLAVSQKLPNISS